MEKSDIPDEEAFSLDIDEEPPVPIPDNLGDPGVLAAYKEKAAAHEAKRQEGVKKRKGQEQAFKQAVGKLTVASKRMGVRRKTAT